MKLLKSALVVGALLSSHFAFAVCDEAKTQVAIKADLQDVLKPIVVSRLSIAPDIFASTGLGMTGSYVKVDYVIYYETAAAVVNGLTVQNAGYIGGYNVDPTTCSPTFLGARLAAPL